MSPNKAVPILVWHAVLHGMWTLLIFSALAAILPSSTQSPAEFWYWLLPLSFILIHTLAYVGFILSRQESFAVQADPQWLIIFTFIIYIIQALLSSSISKTMWIPQPLGYVSISLVPIFLLLQSTTMTAWLDRRIIYDVLEKSTLPLQETLRKDQSLVQKAWYTIQGLQGKNFWILISGITLYGLSFIGSERLLPLFAGLLILISFLMCGSILNSQAYEHNLFELSLRMPDTEPNGFNKFRIVLILAAGLVSFILPFSLFLYIPKFILSLLLQFLTLFSTAAKLPPPPNLEEILDTNELNIDEEIILPKNRTETSKVDIPFLEYVYIALGIILFALLIVRPLYIGRKAILNKIVLFFKAITLSLSSLFANKKTTNTSQKIGNLQKIDVRAFIKKLSAGSKKNRRVPHNKIIRVYANMLLLFIDRSLELELSDTCETIEDKIKLLILSKNLSETQNSMFFTHIHEITRIFSEEVYGPKSLALEEAKKAEEKFETLKKNQSLLVV